MKKDKVSIVIPVFNAEISKETIDALCKQDYSKLDHEIIIYDNPSNILQDFYIWCKKRKVTIYINDKNIGLAASYNKGFEKAKYDKVIIIHEDCVPESKQLIKNITNALNSYSIVNGMVTFPSSIIKNYNFWNKILLYRYTNLKCQAMGKITGFRKEILKYVKFDSNTYRTAGEDMDFVKQCNNNNIIIGHIEDGVIHKHRATNSSFQHVIKKAWQLGEAHGAYKNKYGLFNRLGYFDFEWRTLCLFISIFTWLGLLPFFLIAGWQALQNYKSTNWLEGLITYPFLGSLIMIVGTIASIKSFITGKQIT